jgi:subtilase family serine protease
MGRKVYILLALSLGLIIPAATSFGKGIASAATHSHKVCSLTRAAGTARCHAIILTDRSNVTPLATTAPQGYGPASFKAAYGNSGRSAAHVAVVAAYDAPTIASDLATFSRTFGLPVLPACTSAAQSGCFEKLNQRGGVSYPAVNSSWAVEASMDVESIHGQCPGCRISLVEANSASMTNLSVAVDEAVAAGAEIISNSYGGAESSGEATYDRHYHQAGVTMVASSGDSGYGTDYPAASPYVIAVGGTTLKMSGSRVVSETAWDGAGSGCSLFEYKPTWQRDRKCAMRSIADVAADADPGTGAAIYDSYGTGGHHGWFTVGGTSLAAPLVSGIIAASGNSSNVQTFLYSHTTNVIRDIVSGSNGTCAGYLCNALTGYDGPTGLGVLNHL